MRNSFYRNSVFTLLILLISLVLSQFALAAQIKLAWDPNLEPDLKGYKVYYGTVPRTYGPPEGGVIDVGNVTTYTLTGLTQGQIYYIAVTAYDQSNYESGYSNEVKWPNQLFVDFDGDGKTDVAVYHRPSGFWFIEKSSDGSSYYEGYGGPDPAYTPVPGDYDGDGKTDVAVYHSTSGLWFIKKSSDGSSYYVGYGGPEYIPVPGDYDGDGKTDVAVYHSPSGFWFIKKSSDGSSYYVAYGGSDPAYTPVPEDYDGDGKTDVAVYHSTSGLWFIKKSSDGSSYYVGYGGPEYIPVPGDYDGDGKTDVAVYHSPSGTWFIKKSSDGSSYYVGYGGPDPAYTPVPGDYDGDGKTDVAVYHSTSGLWFIKKSSDGSSYYVGYGGPDYIPVVPNPHSLFTPTDIAGCVLWLAADTGIIKDGSNLISKWQDQSGNGNDLSQGIDAYKPTWMPNQLNGYPVLVFTAEKSSLGPTSFALNQPYTVFMVFKSTWSGSSNDYFLDGTATNTGVFYKGGINNLATYSGNFGPSTNELPDNTYAIVNLIFNGASSKLQVNGNPDNTGNVGTLNPGGVLVGGTRSYPQAYEPNMCLAELIIYNAALSDSDRAKVRKYLNDKYLIY